MDGTDGPGVTDDRAEQIFAAVCGHAKWPVGRTPTLVLDPTVDERELGFADYGTQTVRVSPLVLTRSEDHVASVLAHELGHLAHGPATPSVRGDQAALAAVMTGFLCVLAGAVATALSTTGLKWWTLPLMFAGVAIALCGPASSLAHDRHAELQADRYAAGLLRDTPWDATAVLRDAVVADGASWSPRRPGPIRIVARLLDTHPSHRHRLERMRVDQLPRVSPPPPRRGPGRSRQLRSRDVR